MLKVNFTTQFKKDYKTITKRGLDISQIDKIMRKLAIPETLDKKYSGHMLSGVYKGHKECHIKPDWLLIYYITEGSITFVRTGSHSDLFE
ncbi:MAG TPA: type II toxin-antitoxin system YafQ family toxin [Clostridia bacterium]|nr:type II toxin-antitoxin system YafQ family toxin [Clostridia bacterium]